jgi:hypothetical protein
MFDNLISLHDELLSRQKEVPYSPDRVQAIGLCFATEWNELKYDILEALGEPEFTINSKKQKEENFHYGKWREWTPRLRG